MGRTGTVVPVVDAPAEALRLLDEWARCLDGLDPMVLEWLLPHVRSLSEGVRAGTLAGVLWVGPKDEAVGIATWVTPAEMGVATQPYLSPGYRSPAALTALVGAIDRVVAVRIVYEPVPDLDSAAIGRALIPLGFSAVQRVDMRFPAEAPVPEVDSDRASAPRPLSVADEYAIGDLLGRAYEDSPQERLLFARFRDPHADGLDGARQLVHGEIGTWRPDASFGIECEGHLVAATLVSDHHGALVSEVATDPTFRRRGFASQLLRASVLAVRALGLGTPRLVVTVGNERARRVYQRFGFIEDPSTLGTLWMRRTDRSLSTSGSRSSARTVLGGLGDK